MTGPSRRSVGPRSHRAGRGFTLLLTCASLSGPGLASAAGLESCLVRATPPALEWTLVEARSFAADSVLVADALPEPAAGAGFVAEAGLAADLSPGDFGGAAPAPSPAPRGNIYVRAWLPITIGEMSLLCVTALLPKDWTGWSADFVSDGAGNFAEAWTRPPVWDTDHWFHNYVGHPYGGSFYYNSVRSRGAGFAQSMLFSAAMSAQWEYIFEAVAERPSIQDLAITPIAGAALGELTHRMSNSMRKGRVTLLEKVAMTVLNPADVLTHGYKSMP